MAIYVYRCEAQHDREVIHPVADDPEIVCVQCGGSMLRVPTIGGLIFKGSGFYSTDKNSKR